MIGRIGTSLLFIMMLISLSAVRCHTQATQKEGLRSKVNQYVGYWNTARFEGIENLLCEDFELIESPEFKPQKGIEAFKETVKGYKTAYPDFRLVVDELLFDRDKIAGIWTITATKTGPGVLPATGKSLKVTGLAIIHFKDGKIKDEWIAGNDLQWMQQLGFKLVDPSSDKQ